MPAHPAIEKYIRDYAASIGLDPDTAVAVSKAEALNVFDPTKPDRGGDKGSSFGPFQLHYGGIASGMSNPGLGDAFTKATGLDARDPSTWPQQVKFALDTAKQDGWRQWMGAKNTGIARWQGIHGKGTGAKVDDPVTVGKGYATGGAGAYAPPNQYALGDPASATTSISGVTPPYSEPPEAPFDPNAPAVAPAAVPALAGMSPKKNWMENLGAGIGNIKMAQPSIGALPEVPGAARMDAEAGVSPLAPRDPNRMALAQMMMQRLNSGKLF